jgi:SpoU rRNA methylase family enzyme
MAAAQQQVNDVCNCAVKHGKKVVIFAIYGDSGEYSTAIYNYYLETSKSSGLKVYLLEWDNREAVLSLLGKG